jgi:hypothetical protein
MWYEQRKAEKANANREILVSLIVNDRPLKWDGEVPSKFFVHFYCFKSKPMPKVILR